MRLLLVHLAAQHRVPVICQKPMAGDFETVRDGERVQGRGDPLLRPRELPLGAPIRETKRVIDSGEIGTPFRARIQFVFHKPFVFENQPMLKTLEQLALADVGSHLFDLARFFFGDPEVGLPPDAPGAPRHRR